MPRRKHLRKIVEPPRFKSFKPSGSHKKHKKQFIDLLYEEYEAIKLTDYDNMHHHEACEKMGVSRATFARIYESARQKIARALVEVSELRAVYGNVTFDKNWFICKDCRARFTIVNDGRKQECPICSSGSFEAINN